MSLMRKLVYKNLKLNKKRTIVTVVGIILSVALLSALSTLVMSFRGSLITYEKRKNGNYHVYFSHIGADEVNQIKKNIRVENIFISEELGYALIEGCKNEDKPYAYVIATDKEGFTNLPFNLIEGRMAEKTNEIVIPRHLKTNGRVDYKIGDTITLEVGERKTLDDSSILSQTTEYLGEEEGLENTRTLTYTVVGIMERPGINFEPYPAPGYTFVTYSDASAAKSGNITAYVRFDFKGISESYKQIANILGVDPDFYEKNYADYAVSNFPSEEERNQFVEDMEKSPFKDYYVNYYLIQYERLWPMDGTFLVVFTIGCFVALLIIFTSVYCIKNGFEISVSEKIRQYGMLSGIGATKEQIRRCVFTEAGIMGLMGLPVGLASGLFASYVLIKISNNLLYDSLSFNLVYCVSALAIVVSVILGIITIYLSALSGARKAAKVSPIEAIRNQNEIKINSKKLKTPGLIAKLFGIGGVVSYKNIKRNRKKYRTTVVSIAICTVSFLIISYFMSMGFSLVAVNVADDECNLYAKITFGETDDRTLIKDFSNLDSVERFSVVTESWIYVDSTAYTKEYREAYLSSRYEFNDLVYAYVLDDESYSVYAKECGLSSKEGTVILIKNIIDSDKGTINVFDYKKGDFLEYAERKGNEINKGKLEIAGTTTIRPFGERSTGTEAVVMSRSTSESVMLSDGGTKGTKLCFKSSDADSLQDILEEMLEDGEQPYGKYHTIFNRDANEKQTRSLLVLLSIFAYGLITVMALIGVTNIVNTLNTSMELRARDFATLRSVGMTGNQFEKMIVLETLFTTIKALFWGILLGMLGSFAIWKYETSVELLIPFNPPVKAALGCSAVVFILVYLIIRFSLARINKRNIIDTIKNENL